MHRRSIRTRALELGAAALATACLGGCGAANEAAPPPPTFQRHVATALAAQSDAVADALATGDSCRALILAQSLQRATIAAINARHVDARLQEDLQSAVNDLASRVTCTPPPPAKREDEDHDRGKHRGRGHGKNKGKGDN